MLLVCIGIYLKSVLRYRYLILDNYPDILYLREGGCKDTWLLFFFEAKMGSPKKKKSTGNTALEKRYHIAATAHRRSGEVCIVAMLAGVQRHTQAEG